jgi:DNA helicase-2/ATP-dependent DNA helicase PcrA
MIEELTAAAETLTIHELFELTLSKTGYLSALYAEGKEGEERAENVKELASGIVQFENENEEPTLSGYLEEIALISDIDSYEEGADAVVMMTVHSAKGLEFNKVFLVGMEEGIFPGTQSIFGGVDEMEEERRLAYVAITRARRELFITNAETRLLYGTTSRNKRSRFVDEIPKELCEDASIRYYAARPVQPVAQPAAKSFDYSNVFRRPEPAAKPASVSSGNYTVGMRVSHKTFGEGLIVKTTPMGNDAMLEIAFDTVGTKKIMAGYARLTIL